jgi:hypothetical protein
MRIGRGVWCELESKGVAHTLRDGREGTNRCRVANHTMKPMHPNVYIPITCLPMIHNPDLIVNNTHQKQIKHSPSSKLIYPCPFNLFSRDRRFHTHLVEDAVLIHKQVQGCIESWFQSARKPTNVSTWFTHSATSPASMTRIRS